MLVPPDHPALAGHFPGHPVVPAVVLLDRLQTALRQHLHPTARIAALPHVKFLAPVAPGEAFEIIFSPRSDGRLSFEVRTNRQLCVSGTLRATGS